MTDADLQRLLAACEALDKVIAEVIAGHATIADTREPYVSLLTAADIAAYRRARPDAPAKAAEAGYRDAFYEVAAMLGIGARSASPKEVWEQEMRPKLAALTSGKISA